MAHNSSSVGRIVTLLNFFLEHPDQAFTLAQLAQSLRISRSTCHAILVSLVKADYLYRHTDKSYVVGAGLITLAVKAQRHVR